VALVALKNLQILNKLLTNFFGASVDLMKGLPQACGHTHMKEFNADDLTLFKRELAFLITSLAATRIDFSHPETCS
jgi:hypothetical protein